MSELKRPQECVNVNCVGVCSMADYEFNKRLFRNNPTKCPSYKKGSEKKLIIEELKKIKEKIGRIETEEGGDFLERPATDIIYEAQKIIDNHISELKGGAE